MPFVELTESPHAAGIRPVSIHYREFGHGRQLVFLHGGWGYGVYPIDHQIEAFQSGFRILIPDRSGYGRSTRVPGEMPTDFHQRAAQETLAFLDALGIERAIFWGHSDGAVIGAMLGTQAPERCERLILEAFHFYRNKPGSRGFFERFTAKTSEKKRANCSGRTMEMSTGRTSRAETAAPGCGSPTWFIARTRIFTTADWTNFAWRRCFFTGVSILALNLAKWSAFATSFRKRRCDSWITGSTARTAKRMLTRSAM
jgi:pimeloyl-ACP methyl ester carboxylesterase